MEAHVRFAPSGRSVRVPSGTTLFDAIRRAGLPLATACGAEALCGRCGVRVLAGAESLAPESAVEAAAKRRNRVAPALRLACLVTAAGELELTTDYW
jgi:2Fe-2S ferredoxin